MEYSSQDSRTGLHPAVVLTEDLYANIPLRDARGRAVTTAASSASSAHEPGTKRSKKATGKTTPKEKGRARGASTGGRPSLRRPSAEALQADWNRKRGTKVMFTIGRSPDPGSRDDDEREEQPRVMNRQTAHRFGTLPDWSATGGLKPAGKPAKGTEQQHFMVPVQPSNVGRARSASEIRKDFDEAGRQLQADHQWRVRQLDDSWTLSEWAEAARMERDKERSEKRPEQEKDQGKPRKKNP